MPLPRTGTTLTMDPIGETAEAAEEFGPFGARDALHLLEEQGKQVSALVPDCVGLSLALLEHDVTLTLVATRQELAALDGVQYLFDGPCVEAVRADAVIDCPSRDVLDERGWHHFAQATAARNIASTLTLPIRRDGEVVGTVNLYAASQGAFTGLHHEIADIFGAWAPGAVTNADLSFRTRQAAEQAPERLRERLRIDFAVGYISASRDVTINEARELLSDAAARSGVSDEAIASVLFEMERQQYPDE
jgi:GAF domain-containing protein